MVPLFVEKDEVIWSWNIAVNNYLERWLFIAFSALPASCTTILHDNIQQFLYLKELKNTRSHMTSSIFARKIVTHDNEILFVSIYLSIWLLIGSIALPVPCAAIVLIIYSIPTISKKWKICSIIWHHFCSKWGLHFLKNGDVISNWKGIHIIIFTECNYWEGCVFFHNCRALHYYSLEASLSTTERFQYLNDS